MCFRENYMYLQGYLDVFINLKVQQAFSHLPVVSFTNAYIKIITVVIEAIHTPITYTAMFGFWTRTTRENIKTQ